MIDLNSSTNKLHFYSILLNAHVQALQLDSIPCQLEARIRNCSISPTIASMETAIPTIMSQWVFRLRQTKSRKTRDLPMPS